MQKLYSKLIKKGSEREKRKNLIRRDEDLLMIFLFVVAQPQLSPHLKPSPPHSVSSHNSSSQPPLLFSSLYPFYSSFSPSSSEEDWIPTLSLQRDSKPSISLWSAGLPGRHLWALKSRTKEKGSIRRKSKGAFPSISLRKKHTIPLLFFKPFINKKWSEKEAIIAALKTLIRGEKAWHWLVRA